MQGNNDIYNLNGKAFITTIVSINLHFGQEVKTNSGKKFYDTHE